LLRGQADAGWSGLFLAFSTGRSHEALSRPRCIGGPGEKQAHSARRALHP